MISKRFYEELRKIVEPLGQYYLEKLRPVNDRRECFFLYCRTLFGPIDPPSEPKKTFNSIKLKLLGEALEVEKAFFGHSPQITPDQSNLLMVSFNAHYFV